MGENKEIVEESGMMSQNSPDVEREGGSKQNPQNKGGLEAYKEPLLLLLCVTIGAVLGLVFREKVAFLKPVGQIFLNLLFTLLVPLIFFSISASIANVSDTNKVGKLLFYLILIFVGTAAIAAILMFTVVHFVGLDTNLNLVSEAVEDIKKTDMATQIVDMFTVSDFPLVISRAHILPLIIFSIFTGMAVSLMGKEGEYVANFLSQWSKVFYKMVSLLMKLAPIGIGAYFADLTGTYGMDLIKTYGRALLTFYPTVIVYFFLFLGFYAFLAAGPWGVKNFFRVIFLPALTALGTRSSAAAIPLQLESCDELGVPREISSVVIPTGATCHMDGACLATVYEILLVSALFGHSFHGIGDYLYAIVVSVVASVAVSSVPGGGAAMETMILAAFGFPLQALPMMLMLTQLFDAGCTLLNSCGDTVASMLISRIMLGKDWYKKKEIGGKLYAENA